MTRLVEISPGIIVEAATLVKSGGLLVYPTDTVYGLGCDPFSQKAVARLVLAKERKEGRLPLLVESLEKAEEIGILDPLARALAATFWPGPLTIVVPATKSLPDAITGSTGKVGLRVPGRKDTIHLVQECGGTLVGTSANISGQVSPTSAADAMRQLKGRVELILNGGQTSVGIESTVVKVERGQISILRSGAVGKEAIFEAVLKTGRNPNLLVQPC